MIAIGRTFDEEFIYSCYAIKGTWETISDDEQSSVQLFFPNMDADNYWLEARDGDVRLGVFLGRRLNHVCYEAHTILLPIARGRAVEAANAAIQWMFDNTPCMRLVTNVPEYNAAAIRLSECVGMTQFGRNTKSFMKGGKLYDELWFGISKQG